MRTLLGTMLFAALLHVGGCGEVKPLPTPPEPIRTDNVRAPSFEHTVEAPPPTAPNADDELGTDATEGEDLDGGAPEAPGPGEPRDGGTNDAAR